MSQDIAATRGTSRSGGRRVVGFLALAVFAVLVSQLWDAGSVEIYSVSVSIVVVAFVFYFVGALAMWGFSKK